MKFDLGDTVRCSITEMEGKISQTSRHIYSEDRYCIQPPYNTKEMRMPHSHFIDGASLSLIKDSELETIYLYEDGEFTLGDEVQDTLTGQHGTIAERSLCVNGCYRLKLTYVSKGQDKAPSAFWIEEKGAVLINSVKDTNTKPENRATGSVMETVEWES